VIDDQQYTKGTCPKATVEATADGAERVAVTAAALLTAAYCLA